MKDNNIFVINFLDSLSDHAENLVFVGTDHDTMVNIATEQKMGWGKHMFIPLAAFERNYIEMDYVIHNALRLRGIKKDTIGLYRLNGRLLTLSLIRQELDRFSVLYDVKDIVLPISLSEDDLQNLYFNATGKYLASVSGGDIEVDEKPVIEKEIHPVINNDDVVSEDAFESDYNDYSDFDDGYEDVEGLTEISEELER